MDSDDAANCPEIVGTVAECWLDREMEHGCPACAYDFEGSLTESRESLVQLYSIV